MTEEEHDSTAAERGNDRKHRARDFLRRPALLDVQNQLTQSRAALAQSLVSIYKALGGGWRAEPR
jgi:hypothetical protein